MNLQEKSSQNEFLSTLRAENDLKSFNEKIIDIKRHITSQKKYAFFSAVIIGILIHMVVMVSDWPNHDGLASMYFDQNMITSGRWFLTVACGISSYFTLPWVIGIFSIFYLGITAVLLVDITEIRSNVAAALVGALLVSFPALASTFAYVFTLDGYMLALLMAVAAVAVTKKYRFGWILGAILLALSLGTYQAYLPFAVMLCLYMVVLRETDKGTVKSKILDCLHYLYMGVMGAALYFVALKVLMAVEGKALDTYQGINGLEGNSSLKILNTIPEMYIDFIRFTLKSKIMTTNIFCVVAMVVLGLVALTVFVKAAIENKWFAKPWLYITVVGIICVLPIAANIVMLVSPDVNYHLIMRYQWVLFPILMVVFSDRFGNLLVFGNDFSSKKAGNNKKDNLLACASWGLVISAIVIVICYGVADNIGYSNLEKKYEKTYAYCVRLLDRIEQTEGYYQGIPIVMIGVVSDNEYPSTDLTQGVTDNMIGLNGDYLVYKNLDYESFMQNYLGASLNFLTGDIIIEVYNSEEYRAMGSFPSADSIRIVDGIMYIKTENIEE